MTSILLHKISKLIQVFLLVIISIFYSFQSLAADPPKIDLGVIRADDLIIDRDTPDTITFNFALDISDIESPYWYPYKYWYYTAGIDIINSPILKDLVPNDTVTFDGDKTFILGKWSNVYYKTSVSDPLTFSIQFSKAEIVQWLGDEKKKDLSFHTYVRTHYYYYHSPFKDHYSEVVIPITKLDYAYISGLDHVELPQENPMGFCVSSTSEKVRLEFKSKNSNTTFQLQASANGTGSHTIGYDITLSGKKNNIPKEKKLKKPGAKNHVWDSHLASYSDMDCVGVDNMKLLINPDDSDIKNAPAGVYQDEVTIIVSPY